MGKSNRRALNDARANELICCRPTFLPADRWVAAAAVAADENPANDPRSALAVALTAALVNLVAEPEHLAVLTSKYWGAGGVNLSVRFLDNPNQATRKKILEHLNAWNAYGNVRFAETLSGTGDVRLARGRGDGYWSNLGTDVRLVDPNQATMNLDSFTEGMPLSEYKRVVRHECGHTLGFPHEHLRADLVALLDPAKTILYFGTQYGWSAAMTQSNVLTPISEDSIMGTPVDADSVMCYQISGACTRDGKPIPGGLDINATDGAFCGKLYPGAVKPPVGGGGLVSGPNERASVTCSVQDLERAVNAAGYDLVKRKGGGN